MRPYLSIIIPAHNEESRLLATLQKIDEFLRAQPYQSEVILVENASTDRTLLVAESWRSSHPYICIISEPLPGKGRSVRLGMLVARGEFRLMCDADLSTPVDQVSRFLPPALDDYDVAIGSRNIPGARRIGEPLHRYLVGRAFALLVTMLVLEGFRDTQCGFKCFRGQAAEDLFSAQGIDGYGFDVEVLLIARKRGYRIVEVPVDWYYAGMSRIHLMSDSLRMFKELVTIRRNWNRWKFNGRQ